ncbi:hypothetical protein NBRC116590_03960 [Pelagimonas sp. KU-00592-HH]|uniref:FliM/FliN family flagellar motor switch protein n=1 Tax=Pelagimonas sp. KU-00592-HH TaxID=3127651 RepID=UPI003103F6EB
MTEQDEKSVLRKMATPKGSAGTVRAVPVARLMRRALETAAQDSLGVPLEVRSVRQSSVKHEDLRELFAGFGFMALLEGRPAAGVAIETPVLGGVVEHQTIGTVLPQGAGERLPTRVDAALMAPLLDDALARYSQSLETADTSFWGRNYAFGAMVPEARTLVLALGDGLYHLFEMEVSLAGGAREGRLVMAFPDHVEPAEEQEGGDAASETVRQGVLSAHVTLDAVLARVQLPLSQLQGLAVGETIPLEAGVLDRTWLVMEEGGVSAQVTLGQMNGARAVRLIGQAGRGEEGGERDATAFVQMHEEARVAEPDLSDLPEVALDMPMMDLETGMEDGEALDDLEDLLSGEGLAEDDIALTA